MFALLKALLCLLVCIEHEVYVCSDVCSVQSKQVNKSKLQEKVGFIMPSTRSGEPPLVVRIFKFKPKAVIERYTMMFHLAIANCTR